MKKKFRLMPSYSWLPLLTSLVVNVICFQGTRLITGGFHHYDVSLPIDGRIPLVPAAVLIYVGCYLTWAGSYLLIARQEQEVCYRFFAGESLAKLLIMLVFIFFPTSMVRPEVTGTDFCSWLLNIVYSADTPDNLFPSLHCFASWMCFRGLRHCERVPKWYKVVTFALMFLVPVSVVLTKQHLFLDIFGGIAFAELGLLIANRTGLWHIFERKKYLGVRYDDR